MESVVGGRRQVVRVSAQRHTSVPSSIFGALVCARYGSRVWNLELRRWRKVASTTTLIDFELA